jgi:hypothetical protein
MLHGRIGEPIPPWSRLYKGPWFQKQIEAGYTLSEETRKKAEAMYKAASIKTVVVEMPSKRPSKTPPTPIGFVHADLEEEVAVVRTPVQKTEIGGRTVYLDSLTNRVYDLKFAYVGRYNRPENRIDTSYPE